MTVHQHTNRTTFLHPENLVLTIASMHPLWCPASPTSRSIRMTRISSSLMSSQPPMPTPSLPTLSLLTKPTAKTKLTSHTDPTPPPPLPQSDALVLANDLPRQAMMQKTISTPIAMSNTTATMPPISNTFSLICHMRILWLALRVSLIIMTAIC